MKLTLFGSLPIINSERNPPPRPRSHSTRQPQPQQQHQHRLLPRGNSGQPSSRATVRASKQKRNGLSAEGGSQQKADWKAKERLLRSHNMDLRDTAVMHRGIGTYEGEAVWQGEDELEEGVGVEEVQRLRMQSRLEQPSSY